MDETLTHRLELIRSTTKVPAQAIDALAERVLHGPEEALFRINPLALAESLGISERLGVDLCLAATHAGILEFSWGILCPACAAFLTTPAALRAIQNRHCSMCEVDAEPGDDSIEVAFSVSPAVRKTRFQHPVPADLARDWRRLYFSPSRMLQPQLETALSTMFVTSQVLEPGNTVLPLQLEAGRYAISAPAEHAWLSIVVAPDAPSDVDVDLIGGAFLPPEVRVASTSANLRVHNRSSTRYSSALVRNRVPPKSERRPGSLPEVVMRKFLTGKELVSSQMFRDLFRTESIPSDGGLEFKSLTLLFTDLKGSTELYERIGDFKAYGLVRDHFAVLKDIVAARGGGLVKTIGDAVMASFPDPVNALWAAAEMNREIKTVGDGDLELKIGLHAGPCIAVESNERLDYFGRTVNIAARAQGAADANQIVCTPSVFDAPGSSEVLKRMELSARKDSALFKGVEGEMTVYRLA